ncbi:MAG: hypothetical protein KF861_07095 [Planctomycetaceae bacterium]|nr:hypothetical protein [Planctomycetaceae bacterium]
MTTTNTNADTDFRRLVLLNRILAGVRDAAEIARRLERDREELLKIADQPREQEVAQ